MSMVKLLDMGSRDKTGTPRLHLLDPREPMYKTASPNGPDISIMPDELASFWSGYDADHDRFVYAHINILGAFEYWGPNNNGDAFREVDLYDNGYYKTFVSGHSFLLHNNSNPDLAVGKVIAVGYHPKMHRVELISALDRNDPKATEIIVKVKNGNAPDVSMGCRVPYDICSVCQHKAQKRSDYCDHVRDHMLDFWPLDDPSGRGLIICVFNTRPEFFDQSWVFTRADKSSNFIQELAKAASQGKTYVFIGLSAKAGEDFLKLGEEDPEKDAEMEKTSPDDITKDEMGDDIEVEDKEKKVEEGESGTNVPRLGVDICELLADNPIHEIFDTAGLMGIHITPLEFAIIRAFKEGEREKAAFIHKNASIICAPPESEVQTIRLRVPHFNRRIAAILAPHMEARSFLPRFDSTRKSLDTAQVKTASERPQRVSREYTEQVVSMFRSIKDWKTEFYKNADLVVMGQDDIDEFVENGRQAADDPCIAAARLVGAYKAFMV